MMKRVDLNGAWRFKAVASKTMLLTDRADVQEWMAASVPGTVHTDLMAAGRIPDPFVRMNELDVQWIDSQRWLYRREFEVESALIEEDAVRLVAEGLDTYARVKLNGRIVGQTADMFVEHRFDVKRFLKVGKNVLEVLIDSPVIRSQKLLQKHGALKVALEPHRVYVRKAQYSFGWDWGPKLTTSGIWRDIYLEAVSGCRIVSVFARAGKVTRHNAVVRVSIELERSTKSPVDLRLNTQGEGFEDRQSFTMRGKTKSLVINVPNPRLWWPNGYGDQALYQLRVTASVNGVECDGRVSSFGIRTVRLLQEKDEEGCSFIIEVNGVKIYCKGADWIPCDTFIPRIRPSTYERLLRLARDAHMNMIRVWGGGIYEQDVFYELCDRLGLMVWQDFMFACGEYPEQPWFLRLVEDEAAKAITRLRNHPSVTVWCGNNECEWGFCTENPGKTPDDMNGAPIFRDLLPSLCRSLDGTRPYWRSSPFGSGFPNAESSGNHHQWAVWGFWKDYKEYENDSGRFVTEFGFQAPAHLRTLESVTVPSDRNAQSKVFEHHNKLTEGTERLFRFQAAHYTVGTELDDFIYKGQLVQAEALKTAVEHWRRRKFKTAGSLFWQLNDCWPVSSWAVIDSALRPKAAYYYAKKFFAPILVSFKKKKDGLEVWITNDLLSPVVGELEVSLRSFDGAVAWSKRSQAVIARNASRALIRIGVPEYDQSDSSQSYLLAQFKVGGEVRSENRFFLCEPKHMQRQAPTIRMELDKVGSNTYSMTISSTKFVKGTCIEIEGEDVEVDDNCFDVDAGISKRVRIASQCPEELVRKRITLRSLWS
jgi:beta-mannosidase